MMKRNLYIALLAALAVVSCKEEKKPYDATGTFEATEVTVSSEQNGKLLRLDVTEGSGVEEGDQVALIDTTQFFLKAQQARSTAKTFETQRPDMSAQLAVLQEQLTKAKQEVARFTGLVQAGAANRKLLEDAQSQVKVIERQIVAQKSNLSNSTQTLNSQVGTTDIERKQALDMLRKCHIYAPITGTVLEKYAEKGEFAVAGKPLFKMADTKHLYLRAYLTSLQLKDIKLGQHVKVMADYGDNQRRTYDGVITWISSKAEFTPKTILTDDERASLVYAVKVAVVNDGYIKIGMYGEIKL